MESNNFRNSIVEYIKKDLILKKEFHTVKDSIRFIEYKNSIQFDVESVCEDLINKEYYPGFSFREKDISNDLKALVMRVEDSLKITDEKLNKSCPTKEVTKEKQLSKIGKNSVILFFSEECEGKIYVKALPRAGVLEWDGPMEFYGEAFTYVFLFDNKHQIRKIYNGVISYN